MFSKSSSVKKSLQRMAKISLLISRILKMFLAVYTTGLVLFGCYTIYAIISSKWDIDLLILSSLKLVTILVAGVTLVLIGLLLESIFSDIASGSSPFSADYSKKLMVIGCLLTLTAVFDLVLSMIHLPDIQLGAITLGVSSPALNLPSILGALLAFAFSYIFRYGSLLQKLSDETV